MRREILSGLAVASLFIGCANESSPEKVGSMQLTIERETYAHNPSDAGPKGSGDLGMADKPLKVGSTVLADCIYVPDNKDERAQSVRLADGKFASQVVPLEVYPAVDGEISEETVPVFTVSADEIRSKLQFC